MKLQNTLLSLATAATLTGCSLVNLSDCNMHEKEVKDMKELLIKNTVTKLLENLERDDKNYKGRIPDAEENVKDLQDNYIYFKYGMQYKDYPLLVHNSEIRLSEAEKELHDLRSELIFGERQINVDTLRLDIENCEGIHKLINHYGKDEVYNRISKFFNRVINCPRNYGYELNEKGEYVLINKEELNKKLSDCFSEYTENNRNRILNGIGDILIGGFGGLLVYHLFRRKEKLKNNNYGHE